MRESTTPNEDFENQDTIVIGTDNLETFESVKKMYGEHWNIDDFGLSSASPIPILTFEPLIAGHKFTFILNDLMFL